MKTGINSQLNANLLQLLIYKINTDLFKCIKFEDFKASDVQHPNEGDLLHCWVLATTKSKNWKEEKTGNNKPEHKLERGLTIKVQLHMSTM